MSILLDKILKYIDDTKEYGKPSDIDYFLQSQLAKEILDKPQCISAESIKESADNLWSDIKARLSADESCLVEPRYTGGFDFYKYLSTQNITQENFRSIIEAYQPDTASNTEQSQEEVEVENINTKTKVINTEQTKQEQVIKIDKSANIIYCNGGTFVDENGFGYEENNFQNNNGIYFGYVHSTGKINVEYNLKNIKTITINGVKQVFAEDAIVCWIAHRKIVGFYYDAQVFEYPQKLPKAFASQRSFNKANIISSKAILIPASERNVNIEYNCRSNVFWGNPSANKKVIKYAMEILMKETELNMKNNIEKYIRQYKEYGKPSDIDDFIKSDLGKEIITKASELNNKNLRKYIDRLWGELRTDPKSGITDGDYKGGYDFYEYLSTQPIIDKKSLKVAIEKYQVPNKEFCLDEIDFSEPEQVTISFNSDTDSKEEEEEPNTVLEVVSKPEESESSTEEEDNEDYLCNTDDLLKSQEQTDEAVKQPDDYDELFAEQPTFSMDEILGDSKRGDEMSESSNINIETNWDSNERKAKTSIPQEFIKQQSEATAEALIKKLDSTTLKVESINAKSDVDGTKIRPLSKVCLNTTKEIKWPEGYNEEKIAKILSIKHFLLLVGVPGTGKSTASKEIARHILGNDESDHVLSISFNSATEYTDIVGGIKLLDNGEWGVKTGELTNICKLAQEDPDHSPYIVLIDEINRGDTTGVLGEYMTALADIGSEVTTNFGIRICVPDNLFIIATMNTYDSSIIELDDALKNRFAQINMSQQSFSYKDIKPDAPALLGDAINETIDTIKNINKELAKETFKGENNTIGFRNLYTNYTDIDGLISVIESCIKPNIKDHYRNLSEESRNNIDNTITRLIQKLKNLGEV